METEEQLIQKALDSLPDDCTFEDMQYRLYVLEKVRDGLVALDRGEGVPHEEAMRRFERWLKE